jgi:hypothetical protein
MTFYQFFALYALPVLLAGGGLFYAVVTQRDAGKASAPPRR